MIFISLAPEPHARLDQLQLVEHHVEDEPDADADDGAHDQADEDRLQAVEEPDPAVLDDQDLDSIYQFIVSKFKSLFGVRVVWISTYDEKMSELVIKATTASDEENSEFVRLSLLRILPYPSLAHESASSLVTSLNSLCPNMLKKSARIFSVVSLVKPV